RVRPEARDAHSDAERHVRAPASREVGCRIQSGVRQAAGDSDSADANAEAVRAAAARETACRAGCSGAGFDVRCTERRDRSSLSEVMYAKASRHENVQEGARGKFAQGVRTERWAGVSVGSSPRPEQ